MFWDTAACFGVLLHVLGHYCMFWDTTACFGILLHVLGYYCMSTGKDLPQFRKRNVVFFSFKFKIVLE